MSSKPEIAIAGSWMCQKLLNPRLRLAQSLSGTGIEIGALQSELNVPMILENMISYDNETSVVTRKRKIEEEPSYVSENSTVQEID